MSKQRVRTTQANIFRTHILLLGSIDHEGALHKFSFGAYSKPKLGKVFKNFILKACKTFEFMRFIKNFFYKTIKNSVVLEGYPEAEPPTLASFFDSFINILLSTLIFAQNERTAGSRFPSKTP